MEEEINKEQKERLMKAIDYLLINRIYDFKVQNANLITIFQFVDKEALTGLCTYYNIAYDYTDGLEIYLT